jgi:alcohol dehydrogenase
VNHLYLELAQVARLEYQDSPAEAVAQRIESLRKYAGLPDSLRDLGVNRDILPVLAEEATQQWTGKFNPRPVTFEDFLALYQSAY